MKTTDEILQRLLRSASRATPPPVEPPFSMESRVLAAWRSRDVRESLDPFIVLRPVLMGAFALVCLAGILGYTISTESPDPAAFVTNSAFQIALNR